MESANLPQFAAKTGESVGQARAFRATVRNVLIAEVPPVPPTSMVATAPESYLRRAYVYPQQRALLDPSWPTPGKAVPTFGIDVSNWTKAIDWQTVVAPPTEVGQVAPRTVRFGFTKATQGTYRDPYFDANWKGMAAAGIVRGAYDFGDFKKNPVKDAQFFVDFVNQSGGFRRTGDFAVLDAEGPTKKKRKALVKWMKSWTKEVRHLTGLPAKRIVIYTGKWWWAPKTGNSKEFAKLGYRLWLSGYGQPPSLPGWKWSWWQYTDRANVPGITGGTDANVWRGSAASLWKAAGLSGPPVPLPVPLPVPAPPVTPEPTAPTP